MTTENLWPQFSLDELPRTPKIILNEQAEFLAEGTKNLLTAKIKVRPSPFVFDEVDYDFEIVAPNLGGYKYQLLKISQSTLSMYPCRLEVEGNFHEIESEQKLLEKLKDIFNSEKIKNIIKSLIAQSIEDNVPSN